MCREVISNQSNTIIYNCEDGYEDKNVDLGIWIAIGILITMVFFIILIFVLRCHFRGPLKGSNNPSMLNDKTVVITGNHLILCLPMTIFISHLINYRYQIQIPLRLGCNTGIGKITAHELSKKGARIIMLCRNTTAAKEVANEITKDTGGEVNII